MKRVGFFLVAGATGFGVDVAVLWFFLHFDLLDPFSARVLAIGSAMMCTYGINRTFTFGASHRRVSVEGARYGSVGIASALLNYAVYSACLLIVPDISPFLALILGSGSATVFSYIGYSRFVFGPHP
jgi:putative flippase GtrA